MTEKPEKFDIRPGHDWVGTTEDMLDRLTGPSSVRMAQALVFTAVLMSISLVWAAAVLGKHLEPAPPHYEFVAQRDGVVFVLQRFSGSVAACRYDGATVVCTVPDSGDEAWVRGVGTED